MNDTVGGAGHSHLDRRSHRRDVHDRALYVPPSFSCASATLQERHGQFDKVRQLEDL
jgi:hypothetical protein